MHMGWRGGSVGTTLPEDPGPVPSTLMKQLTPLTPKPVMLKPSGLKGIRHAHNIVHINSHRHTHI